MRIRPSLNQEYRMYITCTLRIIKNFLHSEPGQDKEM